MTQRILIVDDDHLNHEVLEGILGFAGYEAIHCYRGKDIWEHVKDNIPALILLDMRMPDGDGITLCKALKSNEKTKNIPVIIITGQARDKSQREQALDAGAVDFIERTMDVDALLEHVEKHL